MFWRTRRPHIDPDDEAWLLDCWRWLNKVTGPIDGQPPRELVLPTRHFFPETKAKGHDRARHYFELVRTQMGLTGRRYELVAQSAQPDVGRSVVFGSMKSGAAAGTFSLSGNAARVTYDPAILSDPIRTVAVFAHELAHDLLINYPFEPPGGFEMEEFATDLATAHMGFGLFGANAAFDFQQHTDFDRQGWSYQRLGYLTESEWGFAVAVFLALQGQGPESVKDHLKSHLVTVVRRAHTYLKAKPELLAPLRDQASKGPPWLQSIQGSKI